MVIITPYCWPDETDIGVLMTRVGLNPKRKRKGVERGFIGLVDLLQQAMQHTSQACLGHYYKKFELRHTLEKASICSHPILPLWLADASALLLAVNVAQIDPAEGICQQSFAQWWLIGLGAGPKW